MNVNAAAQAISGPFRRVDVERIRQHGWWAILLLAVFAIALVTFVQAWAECRYFYQAELDHYLANPGAFGRPPQMASMPTITKVMRIAGHTANTIGAWVVWTGVLALTGLLLGRRDVRLSNTLRIVAWSWLPYLLRGLVQAGYLWLTQEPIFNPGLSGLIWDDTPPPPGGDYTYVAPTSGQLLWAALLSYVDVYLIAQLVLIVGGLRGKAGYTFRKALIATAIVALILALLALLPALFAGSFARFRLF
jgi:hypothetical protein